MTAVYVPEGVAPPALVGALAERGIVIAGGLHKDIKVRLASRCCSLLPCPFALTGWIPQTKYIRFGHMGVSVVERPSDADKILAALKDALKAVQSA